MRLVEIHPILGFYQAAIDADEEGLAYHTEPMQRAREALGRGEGVGGENGRHL
jgi:hypothetical protein